MLLQDAFAAKTQFVWFDNFRDLFNDPRYLASFRVTAVFSLLVTVLGLVDRRCCSPCSPIASCAARRVYKTLLIWPYAVATAVAAILCLFLLNPTLGVLTHLLRAMGVDWNYLLNPTQALILVVVAAIWKQISYNFLFFLAGLQSIPTLADRGRRHRRRRPDAALLDDRIPAAVADDVLPAGGQHRLRVLRHVRDRRRRRRSGGPVQATTILVFKVYQDGMQALDLGGSAAQSVILMLIVIALTVIQFRYVERKVQY